MRDLARLMNEMQEAGVITNYAVFGAIAQMRYTEPVATLDVDVLVAVPSADRLDVLAGVYEFCSKRGLKAEGEAIRVGAWPTQLIPVFSDLTRDAVESAEAYDFEGVPLRVVRAEYLAVMALDVGRAKDFARILALLESGSTTRDRISSLAGQYGLLDAWIEFEKRFLDA